MDKRMDIGKELLQQPRFSCAFFGLIVTGVLLLFIDKLSDPASTYMIPSIAIYTLGAAFIAFNHRMLGIHYGNGGKEQPIPTCWKSAVYLTHLGWFIALVVYNFWRGAL